MNQKIITLREGVIALPKALQKSWKNAKILIRMGPDTLILKKVQTSSFWDTWEKLKTLDPKLSKKDIDKAITWARKRVNISP